MDSTFVEPHWSLLLERVSQHDQSALNLLYQQTHRMVFSFVLRTVNSPEAAEEITLDVFLHVWQRAATYDSQRGTVLHWIFGMARSRAIDFLRYQQRAKRRDPGIDVPAGPVEYEDPYQSLEFIENRWVIERAIEELAPEERQVIHTTYFQDLTHTEAAVELQQPLGTVKTRLRSGLNKLRKALNARPAESCRPGHSAS